MRHPTLIVFSTLLLAACGGAPRSAEGDRAHVDAMAREHAGHTPAPNASAGEPRQPVTAGEVVYGTVEGQPVRGYLARPASTKAGETLPGIVVVHEWWGLNDNIRMMARRLAGEGYRVLAVDMYHGKVAETPEEARALMSAMTEARGLAHMTAASSSLRSRGSARVGTIGWCFGGGWSLAAALDIPEAVDAAVMYYGRVVTERDRLARLDAPLLGLFGEADQGIPVARVWEMEATLKELGKDVEVRVYEGAKHAFANPSGQAYEPEAAADAWRRTVAFFERHLE
jgi:carboxymethylenebutenolidase